VQLEDHFGDVIRKGRKILDLPASTSAAAAGLCETELTALEESGQCAKPINFTALGQTVGMNSAKLESLYRGWLPAPKDLKRWQELRVFTTHDDGMAVHCYLIWDTATREAALFDTGMDAAPVLAELAAQNLQLLHIFITHSHWDHIHCLGDIRKGFPAAQIHSRIQGAPKAQQLQPSDTFALGGLRITHRETPGHADDGVTYLINGWPQNAPQVAIVGDTIFAGSMGNGNGQWALARQKVRAEILVLPAGTLLCPGHGPLTTVGEEVAHNPFF
jgi:glyoxylase-like metal-dependent hydrolase (beta-lactamase superfamily II)